MQLSPEDIAAAEACGVTFLPATPAQVQRLAMQRKVFYADGEPILATRGDGFYETVGTLQRVIEEGRQQQRDLAAWQDSTVAAHDAPPPAEASAAPKDHDEAGDSGSAAAKAAAPAPKRRRRSRPAAMPSMSLWLAEADTEMDVETDAAPMVAMPAPASLPRGERPAATERASRRGQRWVMAGATRRGRAGKHWSNRQR